MSHNIDTSTGQAAIAFRGSRTDIWHSLGQEMPANQSIDDWAKNAGLDWQAENVHVFAQRDITGMHECEGWRALMRNDTNHCLGIVSDRYQPVQPRDVLNWFFDYIHVDDRFEIDVAGSLKQGEIIWATATFNGDMTVAGDNHTARLLMTTTFDGTGATINKGVMTRVVCNNTLDAALGEKHNPIVRTRHNTKFNPQRVSKELATVAQSFDQYKAVGDAMATKQLSDEQISKFFKACLDIPFDAKKEDISTRKMNQFSGLSQAYGTTVRETDGSHRGTAWAALNAVTRYVDHDRSTRNTGNGNGAESRFLSAQFGSGHAMKDRAVIVLDEMCDGALLRAVASKTAEVTDVADILKQPFRSTVVA